MSGSQTGGISRGASSADMTSVGASGTDSKTTPRSSPLPRCVSYILPLVIKRDLTEPSGWAIEWNQDAITAKRKVVVEARGVDRLPRAGGGGG